MTIILYHFEDDEFPSIFEGTPSIQNIPQLLQLEQLPKNNPIATLNAAARTCTRGDVIVVFLDATHDIERIKAVERVTSGSENVFYLVHGFRKLKQVKGLPHARVVLLDQLQSFRGSFSHSICSIVLDRKKSRQEILNQGDVTVWKYINRTVTANWIETHPLWMPITITLLILFGLASDKLSKDLKNASGHSIVLFNKDFEVVANDFQPYITEITEKTQKRRDLFESITKTATEMAELSKKLDVLLLDAQKTEPLEQTFTGALDYWRAQLSAIVKKRRDQLFGDLRSKPTRDIEEP
eukprot:TRINITY_DN1883_c0_g1_i1.p1 TRINITY_DN1883_c0_g1~~TRINITY_DN1883_c0_g1_i1.p1  ORF type:complete len:309 (+),score=33.22 TRINITY_DN1883_c0_g1_i1:41-928(+)